MSEEGAISGRVIAAARALAGVSRATFAEAAGLPVETVKRLESKGGAWVQSDDEAEAIRRGIAHFGIIVVEETSDMGAGVRLKFTRPDARQIARMESEGGLVGSDHAA